MTTLRTPSERALPLRLEGNRRARAAVRAEVAPCVPDDSVRLADAARVIDPLSGVSKHDFAAYLRRSAALLLPHVRHRPVSLVRAPAGVDGALFHQRHATADELPAARQLDRSLLPGRPPMLGLANLRTLLEAARWDVLELRSWNAGLHALDRPDRMVFGFDPASDVPWSEVWEGALNLRDLLDELSLVSFVKTSGARGLHVVVPLLPRHGGNAVRAVAQAVADRLASTIPRRFVARPGPRDRLGHVFVDVSHNGWGVTTVAPWSPRARPGLGISVPVDWNELKHLTSGAHWGVTNISPRLLQGNQPWAGFNTVRQGLGVATRALALPENEVSE